MGKNKGDRRRKTIPNEGGQCLINNLKTYQGKQQQGYIHNIISGVGEGNIQTW